MDLGKLRFIVMMLTPDTQQYTSSGARIDTHDGNIFCNIEDTRQYAKDAIDNKQCTRFVIGTFVMDLEKQNMTISLVETFGFKKDKKNVNQLNMFN